MFGSGFMSMVGFTSNRNRQFYQLTGIENPDQMLNCNGSNNTVGSSSEETCWNEGGVYAWPTTALTMTMSSDNANDNGGGTGVRVVLLRGLDESYEPVSETVILDGVPEVPLQHQYFRIQSIVGLAAGSSGKNEGTIYVGTGTVTAGKPAVVYGMMEPGDNYSHMGVVSIPARCDAYVVGAIFSTDGNQASLFRLYARPWKGLFVNVAEFIVLETGVVLNRTVPLQIPAKSDVDCRCIGGSGNTVAKTLVTFAMIPNTD